MRKLTFLLVLAFVFNSLLSQADEGMWLPLLLKKYNIEDMQSKGLKLSAEDIYSVNNGSLKDAVVRFGGGCTGEIISSEGLLLTNHHCGYGSIQRHSTVENNYLKNGFWAMNREDEIPTPGLTATFLVRMEDVTDKVLEGVEQSLDEAERQMIVLSNIREIEKAAVEGTHYEAEIEEFYYGSEYYMFVTETFRDVRLVGAPPSSIGKFGGDTDNWMWPRHTGDFSLFRVYANSENKPADYSEENVPYQPKHHFPISLKGTEKDDFTMIFGFPGRTEEYLTSYAVDQIQNVINPLRIGIREKRIEVMNREMAKSDEIWLHYAPKQARVSNYHKKWIGENRGLEKLNAIEKKEKLEREFREWANANEERQEKYGQLLEKFETLYKEYEQYYIAVQLINEAAFGLEIMDYAYRLNKLVEASENLSGADLDSMAQKFSKGGEGRFKKYHQPIDRELFPILMETYFSKLAPELRPDIYDEIQGKFKGDYEKYADYIFSKSALANEEKLQKLLKGFDKKAANKLAEDPAFKLMASILEGYRSKAASSYYALSEQIDILSRTYIQGLREMQPDKVFYPDANSTLRLSYGKIEGYYPRDAVHYLPFTTLEGVMDKYEPGDIEFGLPKKLIQLYEQKDYGNYAQNGEMPVCFIASNHTTGGNSGSPIINADGYLIGTNFDRNWEGTMSDIMYNPDQCRNISVDIRYTLFIIDKFAGASHLIEEMTLIN